MKTSKEISIDSQSVDQTPAKVDEGGRCSEDESGQDSNGSYDNDFEIDSAHSDQSYEKIF